MNPNLPGSHVITAAPLAQGQQPANSHRTVDTDTQSLLSNENHKPPLSCFPTMDMHRWRCYACWCMAVTTAIASGIPIYAHTTHTAYPPLINWSMSSICPGCLAGAISPTCVQSKRQATFAPHQERGKPAVG